MQKIIGDDNGMTVQNIAVGGATVAYISALASTYTVNGGDGVHLNEQGYRLFYVPKITAWLKTL